MSVESLIASAQNYASTVVSDAREAMQDTVSTVNSIGFFEPAGTPAALPSAPPTSVDIAVPTLAEFVLELPSEPSSEPVFQDISPFAEVLFPTFSTAAPTLTMPDKPALLEAFSVSAPSINSDLDFPTMPEALSNPFPIEPALASRSEPVAPSIVLPSFDAVEPIDTSTAPTDLSGQFETSYANVLPSSVAMADGYVDALMAKYNPRFAEQMGKIETQLATYLDGGTGLNAAVEDAIYSRSRSKSDAEARRVQDANWADAATRGFTLPTGALTSGNQTARQAAADINAMAAREIVVMQAEMEQKNLQFAVTQSANLRATLLNTAMSYMQGLVSINGQALEHAKSVIGAVIETYNTAVKAFGLRIDVYKTAAMVHEVKIKSAMATIELYQAEIEALKAMTNVDQAKIEVYKARVDSLQAYAGVWKTQIEAILGQGQMEKLKIDLFQAQVQSHTALVQAKNSEWQGYEAAVGGETAKAKIYDSQVNAYNAVVNGLKASVEAKSEVVRAAAVTNNARAEQYSATLRGYSAIVQARAAVANSQIENERQKLLSFNAQVNLAVENVKLYGEYYRATTNAAIENSKTSLAAGIASVNSRMAFSKTVAELGQAIGVVYAGMANAAMSGMNTLAAQTEAT